jgi:hypothetical protein
MILEVLYYGIRAWLFVKSTCCPCKCKRLRRTADIPTTPAVLRRRVEYPLFTIETLTLANGDTKHIVYPCNAEEKSRRHASFDFDRSKIHPPWFFIGFYDSARSLQDNTTELDDYIYPGNKITTDLLKHIRPGSQRWVYIHPETFEETDFPSEGIVIEQDEDGDGPE